MSGHLAVEIIQSKKRGEEHSPSELRDFMQGFLAGRVPDYQLSAWLMAVVFQGLTSTELHTLTTLMRDSGSQFQFPKEDFFAVDKHSTGGVGDKTSLIIAPLVAAAGAHVPMMAGRSLGHTGGTVDKLESYRGFRVDLSPEAFFAQVKKLGVAMIGQTDAICPLDKKLYALRDVTATVDSIDLISASIMSKKLAAGVHGLVMDVKYGTGAFMKTAADAKKLALQIMRIGKAADVRVHAILSSMNQTLGRYAGNSLEVLECVEILQNKNCLEKGRDFYQPTRELSLELAAQMLWISGQSPSAVEGRKLAEETLRSGAAYEKYLAMCKAQGVGSFDLIKAPHESPVLAPRSGYIESMDLESIGFALVGLGAGRAKHDDRIDHAAGMSVHFRIGDRLEKNQLLFTLFASESKLFKETSEKLTAAIKWSDQPVKSDALIWEVLDASAVQ